MVLVLSSEILSFKLQPIATVHNTRATRLDDDWDAVESVIELDASRFTPDALLGLDQFSHIEVVFHFDRVAEVLDAFVDAADVPKEDAEVVERLGEVRVDLERGTVRALGAWRIVLHLARETEVEVRPHVPRVGLDRRAENRLGLGGLVLGEERLGAADGFARWRRILVGLAGSVYISVATVLGLALIALSGVFAHERSTHAARRLFLFSIVYLPLLWGALVADRLWIVGP